jgi:hypothetical protein
MPNLTDNQPIINYTLSPAYKRAQLNYRRNNATVLKAKQKLYYLKNKTRINNRNSQNYQIRKCARNEKALNDRLIIVKIETEKINCYIKTLYDDPNNQSSMVDLYNSLKMIYI